MNLVLGRKQKFDKIHLNTTSEKIFESFEQWRNHAWSIVVNDQVALWADQVALPLGFDKTIYVKLAIYTNMNTYYTYYKWTLKTKQN